MGVRTTTFRVALLIIVIVCVLIIVSASWTMWFDNIVEGSTCTCSGVSDNDKTMLRNFQIIMLLVGIGVLIYAIVMFFIPTAERREEARRHMHERFNRVRHEY